MSFFYRDNSDLTATKLRTTWGERNKGNSQEEIETFVKKQKMKTQQRKQPVT